MILLKLIGGFAVAMIVVWALLHPSSGRRSLITPRFAVFAAILTVVFLIASIIWALLHP